MLTARPAGVLSIGPRYKLEEQREAAPSRHATGQVVGKIVVRRDPRLRADPQADQRLAGAEADAVFLVHTIEMRRHIDRAEVDRRRFGTVFVGIHARENI
jgi:hypothetical protein